LKFYSWIVGIVLTLKFFQEENSGLVIIDYPLKSPPPPIPRPQLGLIHQGFVAILVEHCLLLSSHPVMYNRREEWQIHKIIMLKKYIQ